MRWLSVLSCLSCPKGHGHKSVTAYICTYLCILAACLVKCEQHWELCSPFRVVCRDMSFKLFWLVPSQLLRRPSLAHGSSHAAHRPDLKTTSWANQDQYWPVLTRVVIRVIVSSSVNASLSWQANVRTARPARCPGRSWCVMSGIFMKFHEYSATTELARQKAFQMGQDCPTNRALRDLKRSSGTNSKSASLCFTLRVLLFPGPGQPLHHCLSEHSGLQYTLELCTWCSRLQGDKTKLQ